MSKKYPVVVVTGSSGAGTTTVRVAFEHMFRRECITPALIEGDSFHRYNRVEMKAAVLRAEEEGRILSHFGPEANLFVELSNLFESYGRDGTGRFRHYLHNEEEAEPHAHLGLGPGEFTPWEDIPPGTDLLFYEGLHGCVRTEGADLSSSADLKIGVVPVVNLEWIQKIHRDTRTRGYSEDVVMDTILRRMHDYVHYVVPQFSLTDINFQRVPVVDTSDPIIARDIPEPDESLVVVHFRKPMRFDVDFPYLLSMIKGSWMSRENTLVVPGGKMGLAMEVTITPILRSIVNERRAAA